MQLNPDDWMLVLADPATNYHASDHALGVIQHDTTPTSDQPILLVDATHLETGVQLRLTIRVPLHMVTALAGEFTLLDADLRSRGAIT